MKIKICGLTNKDDVMDAVSLGADAVGFIFHEKSPRYISPERVEEIMLGLPPFVKTVGVFVNHTHEQVVSIVTRCKLDVIQLHGNESPEFCMAMPRPVVKAIRVSQLEDISLIPNYQGIVSAILLDTKVDNMEGGTGQVFDWGIALQAKEYEVPLILAGGINSHNIKKAVQLVNPYAVDLSSSVEKEPGLKDYNKLKDILGIAKSL